MSVILELLDTPAKRWLALLVGVFLLSVAVVMNSFLNALSPQEQIVAEQQTSVEVPEPVHVRAEPSWDSTQTASKPEQSQAAAPGDRVSPFDNQKPAPNKRDPVVTQQMVHQQADYLRNLIAKGKLPKGLGNLTKEKVDDMEKKGILID